MTPLLIIAAAGFLYGWRHPQKRQKKRPAEPTQIVTVYDCKQAERERKRAAKVAQARRDIETQTERVRLLDALLDSAKAKYYVAVKDKDVEQLTRQILSLEGQIATAENKIEKAKYIIKYE